MHISLSNGLVTVEFFEKVERVAKANHTDIKFEMPTRELGFAGRPYKEMVMLQPTPHCLVNVVDLPFFVVDLSEIEHVHFERVSLHSIGKNFDMRIVLKDTKIQVWMCPNLT